MTNLDNLMIIFTNLGSPTSITLLSLAIAIFLLVHKKPHHFFQFVIFMSLGSLSVWLMKHGFKIPRPTGGIIEVSGYGFPSGHSAIATLFALLIIYAYLPHLKTFIGKFILVFVGLGSACLIAYSRIYLGVHSIYDVVGGISLGLFWFVLSVIFYSHISRKRRR